MIALFVTAFSSSSSRYFLSHVGLGSPFTPSLYKRHYMLPMKIYKQTDVSHTFNLQKVWDQQLRLLIFIRSTIPMISGDFLTRWNAITVGKGRGILQYFIFLHRSLRPVSNVVLLPCRTQLIARRLKPSRATVE